METVTIHKAKTQLSRLIEKACKGEEIVIARGKKPVVRLVAIEADSGHAKARRPSRKAQSQDPSSLSRSRRTSWQRGSDPLRLLLDTHALLWWLSDDPALPTSCKKLMASPESNIFVSAVSAWEISTKFRLGKLPSASDLILNFGGFLSREGFSSLPISSDQGVRAGLLPGPLKDPFDRMLIAQALIEDLAIVSNEQALTHTGSAASGEPRSPSAAANHHSLLIPALSTSYIDRQCHFRYPRSTRPRETCTLEGWGNCPCLRVRRYCC